MRRILIAALVVLAIAGLWTVYALNDRPSLDPYSAYRLDDVTGTNGGVRVTFLGVATLLIDDGETSLLTDGFFTRPSLLRTAFGKLEPDSDAISRSLERAGINKLAAVLVVHSHYDHAMDAPEVARRTGALLVGSQSTANIGRGWNLPEAQIRVVSPGAELRFGKFTVTQLESRHFPHGMAMGEIQEPLVPPARATDYLEGGSYSVLIGHPSGSLLIQGSAGYVAGVLAARRADLVFLGIAGLGTKDEAYRNAYWREVVEAVGATRVVPIHYDDFTLPLDEPLRPMPRLLDDFDASMGFLLREAKRTGVRIGMLPAWSPLQVF